MNAKGNPDGSLSHYSSLRNFRLDRFFDSLRGQEPMAPALVFLILIVRRNYETAGSGITQKSGGTHRDAALTG